MQCKNLTAIAGMAAIIIAGSAPALAGTKDRVEVLERQVAELQSRASADESVTRINQLERQIQDLTGRIEKMSFELDQANSRLQAVSSALAGDPSFAALSQPLSQPLSNTPASGAPAALTGDPIADQISSTASATANGNASSASAVPVTLPTDPNDAFDFASGFLLRGDYPGAQTAFEAYVETFPNGPRTADAQFRLGEIYLATGANADAADAFIAHIRQYPSDPRASEAYLKLGTAFARLEQSNEACKVFATLKKKFPNASPAVLQRADIEMARIQCS